MFDTSLCRFNVSMSQLQPHTKPFRGRLQETAGRHSAAGGPGPRQLACVRNVRFGV